MDTNFDARAMSLKAQLDALSQEKKDLDAKRKAEQQKVADSAKEVNRYVTHLYKQGVAAGKLSPVVMKAYLDRQDNADLATLVTVRDFVMNALYGVIRQPEGFSFSNKLYPDLKKLEDAVVAAAGIDSMPVKDSFAYIIRKQFQESPALDTELSALLRTPEESHDATKLTSDDLMFVISLGAIF